MNRGRRSMGTLKTDFQPQRASSSGMGSSALKPPGRSRLPKPKTSGIGTSATKTLKGKRSTSIDPSRPSSNLFKTPRSQSANRTPCSNRQPLANLHGNSAIKYTGSKRSSVYGGSHHSKENRPLTDKDWHREVHRDLIDFCQTQNFHNKNISMKDFPLGIKSFQAMFEFLYGYLHPGFEFAAQGRPFIDVVLEVMKGINYPGSKISKSHLQSMGGPSWGYVLGVLHFLLTLAKTCVHLENNSAQIYFPSQDADGFSTGDSKSKAEIEYNFFINCYTAYNQGQDEYPDQLEELYWDLIGNMGVDEDLIQQLEQDLEDIKAEHKALEKDTSGLAGLEDEAARVSSDIHGLQEFLEKQKRYKDQKALDLKTTKENVEVLLQKMDDLKESIEALEADCRTKGIDPNDTSNHIEDMVLALQERLDSKKKDVHEADQIMWKAQQELSKRLGVIDNYKRDFKQMLIKLDNVEDARLLKETAMHQDDQQVSSMIRDLVVRLKEDLATMRKNIEEFGQNLALTLDEIERKKKEASAATAEKHKFYKDKIRGLEDIKREEEELSLKFKQAKDSLTAFSRKDKKSFGLREKEDQLKAALRDKGLAEQELKETKEEGEAFIKSSVVQVAEKRDTEAKNRDEAIEAFEAKKKEVTKNLKDLKHQIEQRKEKLPKF